MEHLDDSLERLIIGMMLLDNKNIPVFINLCSQKEVFFNHKHTIITDTLIGLYDKLEKVDIIAVNTESSKRNLGIKLDYLIDLQNETVTGANFEFYIKQLLELYFKRELIKQTTNIVQKLANSEDVFDVINNHTETLEKLTQINAVKSKDTQITNYVDTLEKRLYGKIKPIYTYIENLDYLTGGFQLGEYIVIGARPSMGKTGLGLTIAYNNVHKGMPTLFISLEMKSDSIFDRLVGYSMKLDSKRLRNGKFSEGNHADILSFISDIRNKPFYLDDRSALTVIEIRSLIKDMVKKHGIKLVIIDYLGFIKTLKTHGTRDREIAEISFALKSIAKDLDIVLILLVQINRQVEQRTEKKPSLSDIRDSGTIEQDADTVILINRPEYYNNSTFADGTDCINKAQLIVAKGRNTGTGSVICNYDPQFAYFHHEEEIYHTQEEAF